MSRSASSLAARHAGGINPRPLLPPTTSAAIRSDEERARVQAEFDRVDQEQREALHLRERVSAQQGRTFPPSARELGLVMQLAALRHRLDVYDRPEAAAADRAHGAAELLEAC